MHFDHFVMQIQELSSAEGLRETMSRAVTSMGIGGFVYLSCGVPRAQAPKRTFISSFSEEWAIHCLGPDFSRIAPGLERVPAEQLPFFWGTSEIACPSERNQERLSDEVPSALDTQYWWTVPMRNAVGGMATMSFTSPGSADAFKARINIYRVALHVMAIYFHAHVFKITTVSLRALSEKLTPRELECLGWAAQGKSRTDIGQIIGVSPRTIKFHLENAQRKLNVAHTTQAVLHAALLGLITLQ
jgi:DNA-binding CsgD family transcriptional regulator